MMPTHAVLDANVLIPIAVCDVLMRAARADLFVAYWNDTILDEVERNLVRLNWATAAGARRRREAMQHALSGATITGYEPLLPLTTNDPGDRHVVATAVHVHAQIIGTRNLRHFPERALAPFGLRAQSVDAFLGDLLNEDAAMVRILTEQAMVLRNPPRSVGQVLDNLALAAPTFARTIRPLTEKPDEG